MIIILIKKTFPLKCIDIYYRNTVLLMFKIFNNEIIGIWWCFAFFELYCVYSLCEAKLKDLIYCNRCRDRYRFNGPL